MTRLFESLCAMTFFLLCSGCAQTARDVTRETIPRYTSVAAKTYVTQADLFLVCDRERGRSYLFAPDAQDFPYDAAKFSGEEIRVAWGGNSSITDVIEVGTFLHVDRIEHVAGSEMTWDRIYGRFLAGRHAGEFVQIEDLFYQSDAPYTPILPRADFLKEVEEGSDSIHDQPFR